MREVPYVPAPSNVPVVGQLVRALVGRTQEAVVGSVHGYRPHGGVLILRQHNGRLRSTKQLDFVQKVATS